MFDPLDWLNRNCDASRKFINLLSDTQFVIIYKNKNKLILYDYKNIDKLIIYDPDIYKNINKFRYKFGHIVFMLAYFIINNNEEIFGAEYTSVHIQDLQSICVPVKSNNSTTYLQQNN